MRDQLTSVLLGCAQVCTLMFCLAVPRSGVAAQNVDADGTIHLSDLEVPLPNLLSREARDYLRHLLVDQPFAGGPSAEQDIKGYRAHQDDIMRGFLKPMQARYAVRIERRVLGGVVTDVITPRSGIAAQNLHRVLLNVHGGGFVSGSHTAALVESIPIAAILKIEVVSIDYRMGPEFQFPAASEDVAAVYQEILKHHKPTQVGLYGCSAGGMLTAQSIAWFVSHDLPNPGAIGVLCASVGELVAGDSGILAGPLNGISGRPNRKAPEARAFAPTYLSKVAAMDPLAYPLVSPGLLAKFPPTIFVTGTRSMECSAAINSDNALVKAGVDAEIHIWDGLFHGFIYNSELPESREAYAAVTRFFDRHLSH